MRFFILICLVILFMNYHHAANSNRGTELLHHDGYEYIKKGLNADGTVQFWKCTTTGCNGRAHTPVDSRTRVSVVTDHHHLRDHNRQTIRETIDEAKEMATANVNGRQHDPRDIWSHVINDLSDEQKVKMPNYDAFRQIIQYQRWLPETALIDKENLEEVKIEGVYTTDLNSNRFLIFDSNDTSPNLPRFFLFASPEGIQRLKDYRNWAGDGTFKVAPSNFLQLYIISVMIEHTTIPCIYALLPDKKGQTYERMFAAVAIEVEGYAPGTFMTDFEKAATNAVERTWVRTTQRLCYFHLSQSIMKRVKKQKLTRTYIRKARGNVLFPPETWNHYEAVKENLARTNNGQESFNRILRTHFAKIHPKFSRLVNVLKAEDRLAHLKMENYRLNPADGPTLTTRKKLQKKVDREIKKLIEKMDEIRNPNDLQIYNHLVSLNWQLAKKKFDNWYPITDDNIESDEEEEWSDSEAEDEEDSDVPHPPENSDDDEEDDEDSN
uniref:MULE transposase domain-containing protein n=1 Tax=Panagrolaimus davidi TaxID=227884 RepID=A0A914P8Q0_9BILA